MTPTRLPADPLLRMDERLDRNVGMTAVVAILIGCAIGFATALWVMPRLNNTDFHVGYDVGEPVSQLSMGSDGGEAGEGFAALGDGADAVAHGVTGWTAANRDK